MRGSLAPGISPPTPSSLRTDSYTTQAIPARLEESCSTTRGSMPPGGRALRSLIRSMRADGRLAGHRSLGHQVPTRHVTKKDIV